MATPQIQLDLNQRSWSQRSSRQHCGRKSWGQNEAVQAVVDLYQVFRRG